MYCHHHRIAVPQQIAVVGYNALDIGQAIVPRLTSVETPRLAIGKKCRAIAGGTLWSSCRAEGL